MPKTKSAHSTKTHNHTSGLYSPRKDRAKVACNECKRQHSKCDDGQPCKNCASKEVPCIRNEAIKQKREKITNPNKAFMALPPLQPTIDHQSIPPTQPNISQQPIATKQTTSTTKITSSKPSNQAPQTLLQHQQVIQNSQSNQYFNFGCKSSRLWKDNSIENYFKGGQYENVIRIGTSKITESINRENTYLHQFVAESHYRLNEYEKATQVAEKYLSKIDKIETLGDSQLKSLCLIAAKSNMKLKNWDSCFHHLSKLVLSEPWNQKYRWYLIKVHINTGCFYAALQIATEMVNVEPTPLAHYSVGRVFESKDYLSAAIEEYRTAMNASANVIYSQNPETICAKIQSRIYKVEFTQLENEIN